MKVSSQTQKLINTPLKTVNEKIKIKKMNENKIHKIIPSSSSSFIKHLKMLIHLKQHHRL